MDQVVDKEQEREVALAIVYEIYAGSRDTSLDEFEHMARVHDLIRKVKDFKYAENKSLVVMSKPFTDILEKYGHILDSKYEHPTKGNWYTWLRARIAKTK